MSEYPSVTSKKLLKELLRRGYIYCRTKGSHVSLRHPDDPFIITVIPDVTKDLGKDLLGDIKNQLKLSREEFIEILRNC